MADEAVRLAFRNWEARFVVRGVDYGDVVRLSESIGSWDEWLPRWNEVAEEHAVLRGRGRRRRAPAARARPGTAPASASTLGAS